MIRAIVLLALLCASGPALAISWATVDAKTFRSVDTLCVTVPDVHFGTEDVIDPNGNDLLIVCQTGNLKIFRRILTFHNFRKLCASVSAKRLPTVNDLAIVCQH